MSITDTVKGWIFGIALKKAVVSAAKLIVAWAIGHSITLNIPINGVQIDLQSEGAMIIAINSVLTILRNYLKTKFPKQCGWL